MTSVVPELVQKLAHDLPEVRDRALRSISSKLETGLLEPVELCVEIPGSMQLILHWINERQHEAQVELVVRALDVLAFCAKAGSGCLDAVLQAGALSFLEDFQANNEKYGIFFWGGLLGDVLGFSVVFSVFSMMMKIFG